MAKGTGMGMAYDRASRLFNCRGLDLVTPVDRIKEGYYPFLQNLRAYQAGRVKTRPGTTPLFTFPTSVHTISRLNDPTVNTYLYVVGAGGAVYAGKTQAELTTSLFSGFSGSPLSIIEARPDRSPAPWAYIANALALKKIDITRTIHNWGSQIQLPPPGITVTPPQVIEVTNADSLTQDGNTWNASVNAGALSVALRTDTTIQYIVYDSTFPGYAGVVPTVMGTDIQPGVRIRINHGGGSAEWVVVEQVFSPIADTTVEGISYDSGSTGACWIQLALPTAGLVPNCLLRINGAENVKVEAVVIDKDNKASIRCTTVGMFSVGNTITGLRAFRASLTNSHSITETLKSWYLQSVITYPGTAPSGVGNIRLNAARNLSKFPTRPVTDDDEIVINIFCSDPTKLVEGRVWLDLDPNTTASYTATDLSRNYLFYPFRPDDLQTYASYDLSSTQVSATGQRIQRAQFDRFNSRSRQPLLEASEDPTLKALREGLPEGIFKGAKRKLIDEYSRRQGIGSGYGTSAAGSYPQRDFQTGSGNDQWYALRFKVSDLQRIGTDTSRTLKDITSIMINFRVSANNVIVRLGSWFLSGGGGPDMQGSDDIKADAYYYIVVPRDSQTGAIGLPSPPTRFGVISRRQPITLTSTVHSDTQFDKLDFYRWGGSLFEFRYVGSTDNSGTPSFIDNLTDGAIANAKLLSFENLPPFPIVDLPKAGFVTIVGPKVTWVSGDKFPVTMAPGTIIAINGRSYLNYSLPSSDTLLYLTESAGALTNVPYEIRNPVLIGHALPTIFGPYGGGLSALYIFALGDPFNPGVIYWTNPNDPDTASDRNYLEITSPSEPLVGGAMYDARPYVWSSERMFQLSPVPNPGPGESAFVAQEIANSRGAVGPQAITNDIYLYFVSKDGIYLSEGGQPRSLTDDTLYPIFPHDGQQGMTTNGVVAPDYSRQSEFRLHAYSSQLYFDYPGIDGNFHSLIYFSVTQGWLYDYYASLGKGVVTHYGEKGLGSYNILLGSENGKVLKFEGTTDDSFPIQSTIWTPAFTAEDGRTRKRWGDYTLDLDTANIPIVVENWLDNFSIPAVPPSHIVQTPSGRDLTLQDLNSGDEIFARNFGVKIFSSGPFLELFEWQPSYIPLPENTAYRATDWELADKPGAKYVQGLLIEADTLGQIRELRVEYDGGNLAAVIQVASFKREEKYYPFPTAAIGHLFRLLPTDPDEWRLFNIRWVYQPAPEISTVWESQEYAHDLSGWQHVREGYVALSSVTASTLTISVDGVAYAYSIPSTAGKVLKYYLPLRPVKGKIFLYRIDTPSPGSRLYERDTEFHVGTWGREGEPYRIVKPFGGPSFENTSQAYV